MATPERLGDFEIVEEIGRGGFGIVYRARQVSLDRPVAVKVLFRHLIHTEDQLSRFEREARAAARLDHSAIVSVFAWGQSGEDFFIAQRLVGNGRTLADEIAEFRRAGTPPKGHFRRVAEWLVAVAEGLQQAHDRGIVHRDVKPSNILLDEAGHPCLGDFGLAKVEDGLELSRTGDFAGSPYFMSPEQADSKRGAVDHRTDIYSLGITLYELLTLTQPFQGQTAHEIIRRILAEEPRRPTKIEPRVPQDLETICLKAIEKESGRRYQSAQELADDLQAYLDGEPISAVPIGTTRRVMRQLRRHREAVGFAVLGSIVVIGGLAAGLDIQDRAVKQAQSDLLNQVQKGFAQELSQAQDKFSRGITTALAAQDTQAVSNLVAEQKKFTEVINENYTWLSEQLGGIKDSDSLKQVAAGVATGGLYGGLTSLQQVVGSRKAANERDALVGELNNRLKQVKDHLLLQAGDAADGAKAEPPRAIVRAELPFATRFVSIDGKLFLMVGSQCWALPDGGTGPDHGKAAGASGKSGSALGGTTEPTGSSAVPGDTFDGSRPATDGLRGGGGIFSGPH